MAKEQKDQELDLDSEVTPITALALRRRGNQPEYFYYYTEELASEILIRIANGETLNKICESFGGRLPRWVIGEWSLNNYKGFGDRYTRARNIQADYYSDHAWDIARSMDENTRFEELAVKKTQIETLKWIACKMAPKTHGMVRIETIEAFKSEVEQVTADNPEAMKALLVQVGWTPNV